MTLKSVSIFPDAKAVTVVWQDGFQARFHAMWLRDNALDANSRSPGNGQRLISVLDLSVDTRIKEAMILPEERILFSFAPDDQLTEFTSTWLRQNAYDIERANEEGRLCPDVTTWDARLQTQLPMGKWPMVERSQLDMARWLSSIRELGFAILDDIPIRSGAVCDIAQSFGYVRETNYGRWFDVRSEVNPENLAYTNLGLQAHTDNPYRDPVPTLQLLACLENTVDGGDSILVDGFRVARELMRTDPEAFYLLSRYDACFEYAGSDDVFLKCEAPMIGLSADGEIRNVRFNNRSAAPFVNVPFDAMEAYYSAYRRFAEMIEDPSFQINFKLTPGQLFIVDNTRVLHARKAFSGSGDRWLQGCYADLDGLYSTLAILERDRVLNA